MKKKQGVVMLEVLILLNILIVLIVYNTKTIIANSSKYDLYEIKEDIFYLNDSEYDLLKEVEDLIKNDEEVFAFISSYKDDLNINYEHIFSENENLIASEVELFFHTRIRFLHFFSLKEELLLNLNFRS